jgi:putative ABC transport system substrate-binding protein
MIRRQFIALAGGAAVAWPLRAGAQQSGKVYKIGIFSAGSDPSPLRGALRDGLHELGWIEGKNLTFEDRYAEDKLDRLPRLAAELVNLKVDVDCGTGNAGTPCRQAGDLDDPHRYGSSR